MKKNDWLLSVIAMSMVAVLGCGKDATKTNQTTLPTPDAVATLEAQDILVDDSKLPNLYIQVDELIQAGNTNEANTVFTTALSSPEFATEKEQLFSTLIRYYLFTSQFDAAEAEYLNALRTMPEIATPGFETIYGAYVNMGNSEAALAWARVLSTQDIGDDLRLTATSWLVDSLLQSEKYDEAIAEMTHVIEKFDTAEVAPLLSQIGNEITVRNNITVSEQLIKLITASSKADDVEMQNVVATLAIRIEALKGNWDTLGAKFTESIPSVPDQQLYQSLYFVFQQAKRAEKTDIVETLSAAIIMDERTATYEKTQFLAAREWISVLFSGDPKNTADFPARFAKLMQVNLPARKLYSIYSYHFYDMINDPAALKECVVLIDKLMPQLTDENSQNMLKSYQLDASFIIEDYARALTILEAGMPDKDENWHAMAIAKVKAHHAMKENRTDDAVKYFRDFMATLPEEDNSDPSTGIIYSHPTIMGNNEKRIGDIYAEASQADKAKVSYSAAADWYKKALEANDDGEETAAYIEAQIKALPAQ